MCKNLRNFAFVEVVPQKVVPTEIEKSCPPVLDNVEEFLTLCPVNKVTGHRQNPLDALTLVLSPDKARIVDNVLKEIPSSGVPSDTGTFEFIADRLSLGTDAEREHYINYLQKNADIIYNIRPDLNKKDSIEFDKTDVDVKDE